MEIKYIDEAQAKEVIHENRSAVDLSVAFVKKDGSIRQMHVQFWLDKDKLAVQPSLFPFDPSKYDLIVCNDADLYAKGEKSFRSIPVKRLMTIAVNNTRYIVKHEEAV